MPGSPNHTDQRFAMDYWLDPAGLGTPNASDFWDDLNEMIAHGERIIEGGKYKRVRLFELGGPVEGWREIDALP